MLKSACWCWIGRILRIDEVKLYTKVGIICVYDKFKFESELWLVH